jgi:hypothetical protein
MYVFSHQMKVLPLILTVLQIIQVKYWLILLQAHCVLDAQSLEENTADLRAKKCQ